MLSEEQPQSLTTSVLGFLLLDNEWLEHFEDVLQLGLHILWNPTQQQHLITLFSKLDLEFVISVLCQ